MSDYDRGAYTPPTEETFAFDARTPEVRRPVPATLIGSLVVLVVLVGAVALFYWSGVRGAGEAPKVVGKPQLQIKSPPPVDAKPIADDDGKLDVYDQEKGQAPAPASSKTAFAPAPEQPQPRPTAPVPAPAQAQAAPPAVQPAPTVSGTYLRQAPATPASRPQSVPVERPNDAVSNLLASNEAAAVAAAKTAPARTAPARAAPARAAPARAAPPAKADVAPAGAAHGVMVQIGAFSSSAIADAEFAKARSAFARYTSGKGKHVERAQVGGKVYWRTAFTGFDRAGAQAFCRALMAAKKGCIVR
jgi:hypothetical protein